MTAAVSEKRPWALILGASSGFVEATALELARNGYDIFGVHLDRRAGLKHVEELKEKIEGLDRRAVYFNMNAASPEKRGEVLDAIGEELSGGGGTLRVFMHSLAFGTVRL